MGGGKLAWYTDSLNIAENLLNVEQWRKSGWYRSNGEPVLNPDLWKDLYNLAQKMRVSPQWISRKENKEADALAKEAAKLPTHEDFGFNPGKVGTSISEEVGSPDLYEKGGHVLVRIYKGDGMLSKATQQCKIRFDVLEYSDGPSLGKYYAYVDIATYRDLHRSYKYVLNIQSGVIVSIEEEF